MKETHDFIKDNNKRQGDDNDRSRSNDSNVSHGRSRGRFRTSAGKANADADQSSEQTRGRSRRKGAANWKLPRLILVFMIWIATISGVWFFFYKIGTFDRMAVALTEAVEGFYDLSVYDQDIGSGNGSDAGSNKNEINAGADSDTDNTDPANDPAASDTASNGSDSTSAPAGKYTELLNDPERMEAENCHALDDGGDGVITLRFAGDVLLDDSYAIAAYQRELSGGYIIAENAFDSNMLGLMRGADIFMLNNEFPYTLRGEPTPEKQFTFRAFPADVSFLNDIGTDIVSLANNHAYDYGEVSLIDSMDTLKNAGIAYAGAGHDLEEASSPVYYVNDNVRIAIIASTQIERMPNPDTKGATADTPGVFRSMELDELTAAIKEAKEVSDFVIVFTHWGTEGATEPDWSQNEQAPLIAEAGADLIIGAHPHVLQKIDYEGETPVFYSLGNYLFNSKTLETCLAEVNLDASDGSLLSVRFIPALQSGCKVSSFEGEEYDAALERMRALSPDVNIDEEGYVTPK